MFEWVEGTMNQLMLTLTSSNITLNATAASYFQDVNWCMLGIDKQNYLLAIKAVHKNEIEKNVIDKRRLHKISIGKGYARISNKMICEEIANLVQHPLESNKIEAHYDEMDNMVVADLKQLKGE